MHHTSSRTPFCTQTLNCTFPSQLPIQTLRTSSINLSYQMTMSKKSIFHSFARMRAQSWVCTRWTLTTRNTRTPEWHGVSLKRHRWQFDRDDRVEGSVATISTVSKCGISFVLSTKGQRRNHAILMAFIGINFWATVTLEWPLQEQTHVNGNGFRIQFRKNEPQQETPCRFTSVALLSQWRFLLVFEFSPAKN